MVRLRVGPTWGRHCLPRSGSGYSPAFDLGPPPCIARSNSTALATRRSNSLRAKTGGAQRSLPASSVTINGEGVACDASGLTDFDRLRSALARRGSREPFEYVSDLLELDGRDLRASPWADRREAMNGSCRWPTISGSRGPSARRLLFPLLPEPERLPV